MIIDQFAREAVFWWTRYLTRIANLKKEGYLNLGSYEILFPSILLATEADGFLIAELIGAKRGFNSLKYKIYKEKSIYRYLSQFDEEIPLPLFHLDTEYTGFRFLCLAQDADYNFVKDRFPFIELYPIKLNRANGKGSVFSFGESFSSCFIENSVLINHRENVFRCKNILELFIVKKSITKKNLISLFTYSTKGNEVKGIHTVSRGKEESLIVGGHLQSLYLSPGIRETTIGEFIRDHPDIVKRAFNASHFEYEPYFEWLEHDSTVHDKAINPDLLVRRDDGFYDIYDLKTAALSRVNIVKGERKRRRFIDFVEEGVAQLANYREYFEYPKNREYARNKYGIEIKEPKLVLIVGSWENANQQDIDQACRRYKDIQIIDFDTFTHLFMGAEIPKDNITTIV